MNVYLPRIFVSRTTLYRSSQDYVLGYAESDQELTASTILTEQHMTIVRESE